MTGTPGSSTRGSSTPGSHGDSSTPELASAEALEERKDLLSRYRRGLSIGLALGVLTYAGLSLRAEVGHVLDHLRTFEWRYLVPVLLLSLVNFFVRFLRWQYYLRKLHIQIGARQSLSIFLSGLSMTITPGKAGELLKTVLVRDTTGAPVLRTASVVLVERVTDFIALVLLAGLGIGTYYQDQQGWLWVLGAVLLGGVLLLNSERVSVKLLWTLAYLPWGDRFVPRLLELYHAARALLGARALLLGIGLSLVAWCAECLGYFVVFNGHGVDASLRVCTFLYAFSTLVGVVSPGGLMVTDASLEAGARLLIPGMSASLATAAAFVIRLCTLWFAVLVGSIALMRFRAPGTLRVPEVQPVERR